jgi:acetyltransferase-like isoleucine patch superfamily enzyme
MIDRFIVRIKRGETPFFRFLRRVAKGLAGSNLPVPHFLYPLLRAVYFAHFAILYGARWTLNYFYREPLFRSRCAACGKHLSLWLGPRIRGRPRIEVGDHVNLFGYLDIVTDPGHEGARLIIKDRADLGHNLTIVVNREIVFEEDVNIASGCTFMDSDRWEGRQQPPGSEESLPIRICHGAWIGQNAVILKGVTVGEGAVVGVNSVVNSDIPPFSVALGNPARVVFKNPRAAQPDQTAPAR